MSGADTMCSMFRRGLVELLFLLAFAYGLFAQEPRAAALGRGSFTDSDGVDLSLAWRYAPGDAAGREEVAFDDSRWIAIRPALSPADLPPGGWSGTGWFRRHIELSSELQGVPIAIRLSTRGAARLYVDGRNVLSVGEGPDAEIPAARADSAVVRMSGPAHVLAVRYAFPVSPAMRRNIGFQLSLSIRPQQMPPARGWLNALEGAIVALPLFLALLHLALYFFDRRARENLFYALEMFAFTAIVLREYRQEFWPGDAELELLNRSGPGLPILAILFGMLTYYALRTRPWPKSWRAFVAAAVALYPLSWVNAPWAGYLWMVYFAAMVVEVWRLESSKRVVPRKGAHFYVISMAVFAVTIAAQILVNFDVIRPPGRLVQVYILGILVSAIGMSLFLASTLGDSRVQEAEHRRKTEELRQARELQLSMLPTEMPRVPGLEIAAVTITAAEVGGDYYDARPAGENALLIAFGDATGHGLSSGIVVTAAKALFTSMQPDGSPAALLAGCDRAMAAMNLPSLRMCLTLARVSAREVTIATAAMPPMLIHRAATGLVEDLGSGGLPLGSRLMPRREEMRALLGPGDTLLLASDGLAELISPDDRQLGYDGVAAVFKSSAPGARAPQIIERLSSAARSFRGSRPQEDDVTLLVIRVS